MLILLCSLLLPIAAGPGAAQVTIEAGGTIKIGPGGVLVVGASPATSDTADGTTATAQKAFLEKVQIDDEDTLYAMRSLDFASSELTDTDCEALAALVTTGGDSVVATGLSLADNDVSDTCATALADAFTAGALPNLMSLDLSNTNIGSTGIAAIADAPYAGTVTGEGRRLFGRSMKKWSKGDATPPAFKNLLSFKFAWRTPKVEAVAFENRTFDDELDEVRPDRTPAADVPARTRTYPHVPARQRTHAYAP